jgi:hypothetical protein
MAGRRADTNINFAKNDWAANPGCQLPSATPLARARPESRFYRQNRTATWALYAQTNGVRGDEKKTHAPKLLKRYAVPKICSRMAE